MKHGFRTASRQLVLKRHPQLLHSPHADLVDEIFKDPMLKADKKWPLRTDCSQIMHSTWGWDPYRRLHILDPVTRIIEAKGKLSQKLLTRIRSMLDWYGNSRNLTYSKNGTCWFHDYWPQFDRIWVHVTEKLSSMTNNQNERFIIRDFGCASGEETYLLAMICAESAYRMPNPEDILKRIEIIGYSNVPAILWMAEEGRFTDHKINFKHGGTYLDFPRARKFVPKYLKVGEDGSIQFKNGKAVMHPAVLGMVRFSWLNLLETELMKLLANAWEKADLIVCRRTLYFDRLETNSISGVGLMDDPLDYGIQDRAWKALVHLTAMLKQGGLLVIDRTAPNNKAQTLLGKLGMKTLEIDEDPLEFSGEIDLSGVYSKL